MVIRYRTGFRNKEEQYVVFRTIGSMCLSSYSFPISESLSSLNEKFVHKGDKQINKQTNTPTAYLGLLAHREYIVSFLNFAFVSLFPIE